MLIEQIDGVDPEPFQRPLDGLFDVLRSAVQTDWMGIFFGVNLEPEIALLHCDYFFVAKSGGAGREWHSAVSELLVIHSKDTECRSGRAFPILPILCLILSYVPILCTV